MSRRSNLLLLTLLITACITTPHPGAAAESSVRVEGFVFGPDGSPLKDASIRLWGYNLEGETTTNSEGYYSLEESTWETICNLYAFYDNPETPSIDLMPTAQTISTPTDTAEQVNFTLAPAATINIRGQLRPIESSSGITKYSFEVIDPSSQTTMRIDDYRLIYGTGRNVQNYFLGLEPHIVIVPAGALVRIQVSSAYQYERTRWRRWWGWSTGGQRSETFDRFEISEGEGFTLGAGETLDLDIRKYSLASDLVKLERLRGVVEENLTSVESIGFYTTSERYELQKSNELFRSGTNHLETGDYDTSYVDLRQAYMKLTGIKGWLENVSNEASISVNILIVFISLTSVAVASLLTDSALKKLPIAIALYAPMLLFLHRVYPGSGVVSVNTFIGTSLISIIMALLIEGAVPRAFDRLEGGRGLSRLAAISALFSMAKRNLRRRRLRLGFTFATLLTLTMSFVALTSLSTGYGLLYNPTVSREPGAEGILIRPIEYNPQSFFEEGWFYPVIPSVVDWAAGVDGVASVAQKAENTPTLGPYARVGSWSIFGVLGVEPNKEPMMDAIDETIVAGDPLREDDTCLLEESLLKYDVVGPGDSISIRGVRVRVVGFFSHSIQGVIDMDGESILPKYQKNYTPGADVPYIVALTCEPAMVAITTLETALKIRGVKVSRVDVELEEGVDAEILGKSMALTREYRFWVSSGGAVYLTKMGGLLGGKGLPLLVPWAIVVLNVITTMMNTMYERRREINILSSIGLNPAHVSGVFLAEASIVGVVAGGFGYLLGLGWYPLMAQLSTAPVVQQKISAVWCVAAIGIAMLSVVFGSVLALKGSVVLTPSLRRRWSIGEASSGDHSVYEMPMPIKVETRLLDEFLGFMRSSIKGYRNPASTPYISGLREKTGGEGSDLELSFTYREGQSSMGGIWTLNVLRVWKEEDSEIHSMTLQSKGDKSSAHKTGSFIRRLLMRWTTIRGNPGNHGS